MNSSNLKFREFNYYIWFARYYIGYICTVPTFIVFISLICHKNIDIILEESRGGKQ